MNIDQALDIVRANPVGVLATLSPDGRPQMTVVFGALVGDEIWISVTEDRIKTRNARRDPRVSFLAGTRPWACVEGTAKFIDGLEPLRTYYRTARGDHPDWEDYDRAMIADKRIVLALVPERAYGFSG